ncbi:MAG: helix-turn-helix domain-containing protein [Clostridium sp.]|jgi:xylan 1,4-beta-xylosidase|nr:helix-turn-helix domain-containing protein [Clostridium sp.]
MDSALCKDTLSPERFFWCDSSRAADKKPFYTLKYLIALLVKTNAGGVEQNTYYNLAIAYNILSELKKNFPLTGGGAAARNPKYEARLRCLVNYINEHYAKGVTLKELAGAMNLSVPYLSAFFEKSFGVNFTAYYSGFRLERAVNELLSSSDSIETIALRNGFADARMFVSLFQKRYGERPSVWRKALKQSAERSAAEYISGGVLYKLSEYLAPPGGALPSNRSRVQSQKQLDLGKVSIFTTQKTLRHTFRTFTSVGRAKELLYADVQEMLRKLQSEFHYEYIKFHGILSDDMLLYSETRSGEPQYSFVFLDKAIDFLVSIGLKPLVQFSFMPQALASGNETVFFSPFNVTMPRDGEKWAELIYAVTKHFVERYGLKAVKTWLFCVWNEANMSIWNRSLDDYKTLYKLTYTAVKRVHRRIPFGMPSVTYGWDLRKWTKDFLAFCRANSCMPAFCNLHYYDNEPGGFEGGQSGSSESFRLLLTSSAKLNNDEKAFQKAIAEFREVFAEAGDVPVYMTEWNMTASHRNLLNDTCFKACYLAKNILENYDALDSFGYWVLTDLIEETQPSNEHFHGGLGLFTHSGIPKAHYHVFTFLNRLGDRLVKSGEGYFITKSHGAVQIILYNYEHFSHLFASGETFDMSLTQRDTPFLKLDRLNVSLELADIPAKSCVVKEQILNQRHGSAFDAWVEMGAMITGAEDVEYLKRVSVPKIRVRREQLADDALSLNVVLEPLEVRLIEIEVKG